VTVAENDILAIGQSKLEKDKPTLKAIRGKPRASARHGALQMPTFNKLACKPAQTRLMPCLN